MRNRIAFLSAVAAVPLMLCATGAAAQSAAQDVDPPAVHRASTGSPGPWLVRAEGSLVDMRDNWLEIPQPEVGLTVGRDLTSRFAVELTGNVRQPDSASHHSWSALALGRVVVAANPTRRHALTLAAGPLVEVGHFVHGTMPFAHSEIAYVYRAPFGLTVLAGGGLNFALADSPYIQPPPPSCPDGDGFCLDFGPDAREIHTGDATVHTRLAVGWQF
jgi:hypothetical protein